MAGIEKDLYEGDRQETSSGALPNTTHLSEANIQDVLMSHTALWVDAQRKDAKATLPKPQINSADKSALSFSFM